MRIAMGATALLCVAIGVYPRPLYALLPWPVDYEPYTASHVVGQYQLLLFAALAFWVLVRTGLYPRERPSVNLDSDWIYRKLLPGALAGIAVLAARLGDWRRRRVARRLDAFFSGVYRHYGPESVLARTWATSTSVLWILLLLIAVLIAYYA